MTDAVLARVAAIKTMEIGALKDMWRELFQAEPPPYNRTFLESRLAYRIQELAYGGLKPQTGSGWPRSPTRSIATAAVNVGSAAAAISAAPSPERG